jgi:REP-associated tyrosine transposase
MLNQVRAARSKQLGLAFRPWGGARKGAGRRPHGDTAGVPHRPRGDFSVRHPLHVTVRLCRNVPSLRAQCAYDVVLESLRRGNGRFGLRVVHFSVQGNHIHLIAEADGTASLARGMKGLCVRLARRLNAAVGRHGRVFADRYHARALSTPREVHRALRYVLLNRQQHENRALRGLAAVHGIDSRTSAEYFDGWAPGVRGSPPRAPGPDEPVRAPSTWLLRVGWTRHGRIDPFASD